MHTAQAGCCDKKHSNGYMQMLLVQQPTTSMSVHRLLFGALPWWSMQMSTPLPWENTLRLEYTATSRS